MLIEVHYCYAELSEYICTEFVSHKNKISQSAQCYHKDVLREKCGLLPRDIIHYKCLLFPVFQFNFKQV